MKRKINKYGFTLIELLAVITIMGILMIIAIPAVNLIIDNSRKSIFVDTAKQYVNSAKTLWATDNLTCEGVPASSVADGDYYILINTKDDIRDKFPILLEQGGKSSWGERDLNGYVRVNVSTIPAKDNDGDGIYEVQAERVTKFYVALSDGIHGLMDDGKTLSDNVVKGNIKNNLSDEDMKKIQLTIDDGRLSCIKNDSEYLCVNVLPVADISGICVDDQAFVSSLNFSDIHPSDFETDDWGTIIASLKNDDHPYEVGDTKVVDMGDLGKHKLRIANLSRPSECNVLGYSQTACGVVFEFVDIITNHNMNPPEGHYQYGHNRGGWTNSKMRKYVNETIYNSLPAVLRHAIIDTYVVSNYATGDSSGTLDNGNFESNDKIYLLSVQEVFGAENFDTAHGTSRQLDYYSNIPVSLSDYSMVVKKNAANDSAWWALRSAAWHTSHAFYAVKPQGNNDLASAANSIGVSPAFRIA